MLRELINTQPDPGDLIRAGLRYDYSLIPDAQRDQVQAAAVEIVRNGKRAQESLILIGERLIEIKAILEHGQFGEWCETEFSFTQRTAQNMMNVAQTFGGEKRNTVSFLSDSALYLLAAPSTPDAAREAVIEQAQATGQSPTKAEVQAVIASHKPTLTQLINLVQTAPNLKASDLRSAARNKRGHWLYDKAAANAEAHWPGAWTQTQLVQALQGVADRQDRQEMHEYNAETVRKADALTVPSDGKLQAMIERMATDEQYNLWPDDEAWLIDQIISHGAVRGWAISKQLAQAQLDETRRQMYAEDAREQKLARARQAATLGEAIAEARLLQSVDMRAAQPAIVPGTIPPDLAARGWELRQVPGSGRWYANNPNGPRATGIYDRPEAAVAACYDMQRDLRPAAPAAAAQPQRSTADRGAVSSAVAGLDSAVRQMERAYEAVDGWDMEWCESLSGAIDLVRRLRTELSA